MKNFEIDFQDGRHCIHLKFSIGTILLVFVLQVNLMLPTKFPDDWAFGSGKKNKRDFQHGGYGDHLGLLIETILAISDLQFTPIVPTKFRVSKHFGSGEGSK